MEDRKRLLPEREYRAWDKAEVDERTRTMGLLLKFNTTGDREILEEVFGRDLDGVTVFAPLHCNYGDSRVKFGSRVFINYNCTLQPAGGVEIGDDVFIGSDVRIYTTNHPLDPEERAKGKATVRPGRIGSEGGVIDAAHQRTPFRFRFSAPEIHLVCPLLFQERPSVLHLRKHIGTF